MLNFNCKGTIVFPVPEEYYYVGSKSRILKNSYYNLPVDVYREYGKPKLLVIFKYYDFRCDKTQTLHKKIRFSELSTKRDDFYGSLYNVVIQILEENYVNYHDL